MNRRLGILTSLLAGTLAWLQARPALAQQLDPKIAEAAADTGWDGVQRTCNNFKAACAKDGKDLAPGVGVRSVPPDEVERAVALIKLMELRFPAFRKALAEAHLQSGGANPQRKK